MWSLRSELVGAVLSHVAHPRDSLVATLLEYLEVLNAKSRNCEERNLEGDDDRALGLFLFTLDRWKTEVGTKRELLTTWELLDCPDERVIIRRIPHATGCALCLWSIHVWWHWDFDLDVLGNALWAVLSPSTDEHFNPSTLVSLNCRVNVDDRLDRSGQTVAHQLELAIWWNECDGTITLELREADTRVELDILKLEYTTGDVGLVLLLIVLVEENLIVQADAKLGHTRKVCGKVDLSIDFVVDDSTVLCNEHVHFLDDIDEHFVDSV